MKYKHRTYWPEFRCLPRRNFGHFDSDSQTMLSFLLGNTRQFMLSTSIAMVTVGYCFAEARANDGSVSKPNESKAVAFTNGETNSTLSEVAAEGGVVLRKVDGAGDLPLYYIAKASEPDKILNIQDGPPKFSSVPASWWSGQWLLRPQDGGVRISSRWKPAISIGLAENGKLSAVSSLSESSHWNLKSSDPELSALVAPEMPPEESLEIAQEPEEEASPDKPVTAEHRDKLNAAIQKARSDIQDNQSGDQTDDVQAAAALPDAQVDQVWAPDSANSDITLAEELEAKPEEEPIVEAVVTSEPENVATSTEPEVEVSQVEPVSEPIQKKQKEIAPKKTILERIRGEFVADTNATEEVGPFHAFQKFYITDLFTQGDVYWIMGDTFSLGEELLALRAGFQTPLNEERDKYLRYTLNYSQLNPFPVDNDFQTLEITEHEHRLEMYKITAKEKSYNETGFFITALDSNQSKLELGDTIPRDLSFISTDIGLFTLGSRWKEDEHTKTVFNYRASISQGVSLFGASDTFEVREEASVNPLVIKGGFDLRHEWKEKQTYWHARAGFHYADRTTEWHKHFALGGDNFVRGFKAAEAAGEIGAGASIELGKRFAKKHELFGKAIEVAYTPYVEGGVAFTQSLFDDPAPELEYARDAFLGSASLGLKTKYDAWEFDVSYGLPLFGESRFAGGLDGRLAFRVRYSW